MLPEQTAAQRRALELLDAVHAQIPDAGCKGLCGAKECVLIAFSPAERTRLDYPYPDFAAAHASNEAASPLRASPEPCPLLTDDGRCSVYEIRPVICRVWGVSESLRCPHGCGPADGRYLTDAQAVRYMLWSQMLGDLEGFGVSVEEVAVIMERYELLLPDPLLAGPLRRLLTRGSTQIDLWLLRGLATDVRAGRALGKCRSLIRKRAGMVERYGDAELEQRAVLEPFVGAEVADEREAIELTARIARELMAVEQRPVSARSRGRGRARGKR